VLDARPTLGVVLEGGRARHTAQGLLTLGARRLHPTSRSARSRRIRASETFQVSTAEIGTVALVASRDAVPAALGELERTGAVSPDAFLDKAASDRIPVQGRTCAKRSGVCPGSRQPRLVLLFRWVATLRSLELAAPASFISRPSFSPLFCQQVYPPIWKDLAGPHG
jgi:hypothetical protein